MLVFLVCLGLGWFFILFLHTLFKTCMLHPYIRLHEFLGLDIRPFAIYWRTTRFNHFINRMSYYYPSFFKAWFNVGAFVTCLVYIPCVFLVILTIFDILHCIIHQQGYETDMLIVPIIPGINFPSSKLLSYFLVVLVCSVTHEFGHALAASRERISIELCGFALYVIFPFAFVNVRSDQFQNISKWQQMKILCAGIWHNIVIAVWACFILSIFPVLMSPFYYTGSGVSVVKVDEQSGLNNVAGLDVGDHIYKIGDCNIEDMNSWLQCLEESKVLTGLCVPKYFLHDFNNKSMENCSKSLDSLYFTAMRTSKQPKTLLGACLKARSMLNSLESCHQETRKCKRDSLCSFPALEKSLIFTSITRLDKPAVLYVGSIDELKVDVTVSELLPRSDFFPAVYAQRLKEFMEYLLMFSCGLACFNLIPALGLDGEYIVETLIHISLSGLLPRIEQRRYLCSWIRKFAFFFVLWWLCAVILITLKERHFI